MEVALPDGMRRALLALREGGGPVEVDAVAQQLLALSERPAPELARRLVAGLLGAAPASLPAELEPDALRTRAERRAAAVPLRDGVFTVVDVETTGLSPKTDAVIEIGAARVVRGEIASRFETLLRPPGPGPLSTRIERLTGIASAMLADAPSAAAGLGRFRSWLEAAPEAPWVAHNARFDRGFLERAFRAQGEEPPGVAVLCTQKLSRRLLPRLGRYDLDHLCAHFGIGNRARHRALGDAEATARAWIELLESARAAGHARVGDLLDLQERPIRRRRKRKSKRAGEAGPPSAVRSGR